MNLLELIQEATARIAIEVPSTVSGNSDAHERQLLSLINEEGAESARRYPWQFLIKEQTFMTVATPEQPGVLPADLGYISNGTFFNRSQQWSIKGPLNGIEWQELQASPQLTTQTSYYRIRGSELLLYPTPSVGETIAFEYISKNWALTGVTPDPTDRMTADTDSSLFDDELMILGVKWRYLREKGLDYSESFNLYEQRFINLSGTDGSKRILSLVEPSSLTAWWSDRYWLT